MQTVTWTPSINSFVRNLVKNETGSTVIMPKITQEEERAIIAGFSTHKSTSSPQIIWS